MSNYVRVEILEASRSVMVIFNNEDAKPFSLGEKMSAICEEAYMNGYNWSAFLRAYLSLNAPHLLDDLEEDPESGGYYAYYPLSSKGKENAKELSKLITFLIENEEETLEFLEHNAQDIEWD